MPLSAEQRRALAMLATAHNGATQLLLRAHGFSRAMITGLVICGFAILTRGNVRGGGRVNRCHQGANHVRGTGRSRGKLKA
jgi:hypothetical protein